VAARQHRARLNNFGLFQPATNAGTYADNTFDLRIFLSLRTVIPPDQVFAATLPVNVTTTGGGIRIVWESHVDSTPVRPNGQQLRLASCCHDPNLSGVGDFGLDALQIRPEITEVMRRRFDVTIVKAILTQVAVIGVLITIMLATYRANRVLQGRLNPRHGRREHGQEGASGLVGTAPH
jgi:hypothetical protein